jgi:hypothetical protein
VVEKRIGLKMTRRRMVARSALGLALLLGIPVAGQSPYPQFPSSRGDRTAPLYPDGNGPVDQGPNSPEKRRLKLLNAERQKSLTTDADKLLKLARELNDEVAQSESGSMSGAQVRKVEEIGKLAKSVKEKMTYSAGGFPNVSSPLTIQPGIQ